MKRCVECKGSLKAVQTKEVITIGEHRISLSLPARRCESCRESYIDGEVAERADLIVASRLLDLGIATGAAFRFMRKALGLRAIDLAELLNVDAATVSRWENGKVAVDRAAIAALAAAASERLEGRDATLTRLRCLREGKRPARTLRIDLAKAS
jgi:putative zinc finger/helix-turn-helix YgiT family protein